MVGIGNAAPRLRFNELKALEASTSRPTFSVSILDTFAIMRLGTSPTPIGLTPGHLSRGMRRQATRALMLSGFTNEEQRRR